MKSNKQGKVRIPKSGYKRSKFNWSHDVNTTFAWGEIQPTQCKMLIPGSKTTMSTQSLIRLAPMVVPTFGRVKYKTYNQFVSMAEIMPNFDAMMAQEPVSTSYGTQVPKEVPTVALGVMSSWVLHGCRATLYFGRKGTAADDYDVVYSTYYRQTPTAVNSTWNTAFSALQTAKPGLFQFSSDPFNSAANGILPNIDESVTINLGMINTTTFGQVFAADKATTVMGIKTYQDMCPVDPGYVPGGVNPVPVKDYQKEVTFDSADYILEGNYTPSGSQEELYFALAVELSDFGKRLRKVIQGCGYQIDFTSTSRVSILPLIAQYKAYFDIFGLELFKSWETTYCSKMIKWIENDFRTVMDENFLRSSKENCADANTNNAKLGLAFMLCEVGNEFYTDDIDYVSAHIDALSISPQVNTEGFLSVRGDGSTLYDELNIDSLAQKNAQNGIWSSQTENDTLGRGPGINDESLGALNFIDAVHHTQVDAEMLKRLYKWTNRNTILGRRIAELLRAQGLGKYVDECKSNYIGSTDTLVTISDVVSTAATEGAALGEYGGKGLQYTEGKTLVFENDSYGYWVTLATVVPEAGYTQGLDPTLTAIDKMNLYNPDFDAVGMEATPKENIVATNYIVGDATGPKDTFGFVPRYSKFKVAQNLTNGDFNRRSLRNTYMPYTLDKQINCNDYDVVAETITDSQTDYKTKTIKINKSYRTMQLPIAGNVWRYPTKYNWLGNFDRIFLRNGVKDDDEGAPVIDFVKEDEVVGWRDYNDDNFLSHSIYEVNSYAPMKPIVESYGLDEDDPMIGNGSEFVTKA